ncbi:hypothetical protein O3G_MSEX003902 [Manduca sexta]|uniref:ZU5 domain-containing protein n=2 Tax=Manduca sexta TaxID=7130 RepID=A0A922CGL2_MANSE|nr:hypothetical protein O3G_MSEX003902 [Manduca sexta]
MGVVKHSKNKTKNDDVKKKDVPNGKPKNDKEKVKKKKLVSCLQCIKSNDDGGLEGKYRVAAPELMQDTFMSDSEDEGGEVECPIQQQQQYRYMNSEAGTLHRAKPLEDSVTDGHLWPSNNDRKVATIERQPVDIGFLVSFVVDARGGAMKAKRRGGVRIIVPPAACAAPTRVTCRAATRRAPAAAPPPLMEGEALASRLLELQPQGAKFLAPVIIEVPIFTSSCPEREIVILRSDNGETWQDHYLHNNDNPMIQEALQRERQEFGPSGEAVGESGERVTRIVTCEFPHYLACVSRVRQEVHVIGPDGGAVSSAHIAQVQAVFPPAALTKRIRVGLQAHGASTAAVQRVLPRHAAVSPVVTVEPRRRKFHRSITLTVPLPPSPTGERASTSNLRLLCSIMGGQARAVWEDVTGSTPLTITDDCASFTTTVSARFWLMNCQNVSDATKLATELYREMLLVPFEVRIVVLGKRLDALEGRLLVMTITDRYAYDTLLQQEHYTEVAHSTSVKFLDGKDVYLEFSGNLVPVTKSGSQPMLTFEAFKDNRVEFTVRVKHHEESPSGRIYFMNEPKVPKGEQSQTPTCVLDVELPERIAPRAGKSQLDYLNLDQSGFDALKDELSFHWGEHNNSLGPGSLPYHDRQVNGHDKIVTNGDVLHPTKDTDSKDTRPQVNGDTLHVDSNKVKATFDSDEDKTPQSTLEKGKKKPETSFLGGLADKVKNVFGHSEEKDDEVKESSPKPQPKPRESKDKSPPKPAPRIINEELLDKVEDMFKDLHQKPPQKDEEDPDSHLYATKLVVEEDEKSPALKEVEEHIYEEYANMQPVDTPLYNKKTDPFQFYVGCCEGKFKKGQKHRHDETSNLVDRIEQVTFATHEIQNELADDIGKLQKRKDDIKQKSVDVIDEVVEKSEKIKDDVKNKEQELKKNATNKIEEVQGTVDEKLNSLKESADKLYEDVDSKASVIKTNINEQIDDAGASAKDAAGQVQVTAGIVNDKLKMKALAMDFVAMEQAEELKNRANEKIAQAKRSAENSADHLKHKSHEIGSDLQDKANKGAIAVGDVIQNAQETLTHKAQDIKHGATETSEKVKDSAKDKLHALGESLDGAKQKSKKAAADLKAEAHEVEQEIKKEKKKKSKQGKNFFTGLVHNIFGEKEKLEDEIKGKIAEGKEVANDLAEQASAKKDEIKDSVAKKEAEVKEGAGQVAQTVRDKTAEAEKALQDTKDEVGKAVHDKVDEAKKTVEEKSSEIKSSVEIKVSEAKDAIVDKTNEVKDAVNEKASEAKDVVQNKTNEIRGAIIDNKDAVCHKASEIKDAIHDTAKEAKDAVQDKANKAQETVENKASEVKNAFDAKQTEVKNAILDATSQVQDAASEAKDAVYKKTSEMKDTVQSKTVELKDAAFEKGSEISAAISDKAQDAKHSIETKTSEIKDAVHTTTTQVKDAVQNKAGEVKDAVSNKTAEVTKSIQDTTNAVGSAISSKKDDIKKGIHDKADQVKVATQSELDRIRQEAEQTTEQIKKTAEDTINAAASKKAALQGNIENKFDNVKQAGKDELENLQQRASDLQESSQQAFSHAQDSTLSTFDKIESSAKDKVNDAKDTWEDLQSSTRDTFASFRDDVGSSAQDTLRSFQSSAGNTFDSLDDSAKEIFGGVQTTANNVEAESKELFGEVQDSFEGFQVSADNKLEDIKGSAKERLEEAEERLHDTKESVKESARETEQAVAGAVAGEADKFTSSLNNLGNSVFGSSGKGFMKDSSTKLLESEKAQSSPHKKSSGIPKLKRKK